MNTREKDDQLTPQHFNIKCFPRDFDAIAHDLQRFVIVYDRGFRTGDYLNLQKTDGREYMGKSIEAYITRISNHYQAEGYVVVGIAVD